MSSIEIPASMDHDEVVQNSTYIKEERFQDDLSNSRKGRSKWKWQSKKTIKVITLECAR